MSILRSEIEPTYVSKAICLYCNSKAICLYCNKEFSVEKVRSRFINVTKKDGDLCCHYAGINPYFYEVYICPHCKFSFTEKFSSIKPHKREILNADYIDKVRLFKTKSERDLDYALKAFKLALLCGTLTEQSNFVIAGLCMKIAWLNRYIENESEEKRFLQNALKYYVKTYENEDLNRQKVNKDMLLYLIAELHGRLGNYEEARKWFSIIISDKTIDYKVMKLARERWSDYKYDTQGTARQ